MRGCHWTALRVILCLEHSSLLLLAANSISFTIFSTVLYSIQIKNITNNMCKSVGRARVGRGAVALVLHIIPTTCLSLHITLSLKKQSFRMKKP